MASKIKNILLDMGGVIMNLDVQKTIDEFKKLGIDSFVNETGHNYTNGFFYGLEKGEFTESQFLKELSSNTSKKVSSQEIVDAWNSMLLGMPKDRIDFILELKKNYKVYLLSNTNCIHQKKFKEDFKKDFGYEYDTLYEKAYYSHEVGMRKPDEDIYRFVINDAKIKADETIFADDSMDNLVTAKKCGLQIFHVQNYNTKDILKII